MAQHIITFFLMKIPFKEKYDLETDYIHVTFSIQDTAFTL